MEHLPIDCPYVVYKDGNGIFNVFLDSGGGKLKYIAGYDDENEAYDLIDALVQNPKSG